MTADRRRHVRFALRAPVSFLCEEKDGVRLEGNGFTRDVSERGVFILTNTQATVGAGVRIEIIFRSLVTRDLLMSTEGQVRRVEPSFQRDKILGFAVETKGLNYKMFDGKS